MHNVGRARWHIPRLSRAAPRGGTFIDIDLYQSGYWDRSAACTPGAITASIQCGTLFALEGKAVTALKCANGARAVADDSFKGKETQLCSRKQPSSETPDRHWQSFGRARKRFASRGPVRSVVVASGWGKRGERNLWVS